MKLQVGVKVLVQNKHGEYLLLRRDKIMDGETEAHWDIPGGRIEPEEALFDALKREIMEETGLAIPGMPKLLDAQDIFVPAADLHVVRLTYSLQGEGNAVVISDEHQEARWVTPEEAKTFNLDPYLRKVLEK
jgi:8-oxo-dGTP diphosphatase